MQKTIWVLHGPNLNLLGSREPDIYGHESLADVDRRLIAAGAANQVTVVPFQSNHEGLLIDRVQQAASAGVGYIIINPAALTHTSIALRDALAGVAVPFIEIHLSNIYRREAFRHRSYFSELATGTIAGFGTAGYLFALEFALAHLPD